MLSNTRKGFKQSFEKAASNLASENGFNSSCLWHLERILSSTPTEFNLFFIYFGYFQKFLATFCFFNLMKLPRTNSRVQSQFPVEFPLWWCIPAAHGGCRMWYWPVVMVFVHRCGWILGNICLFHQTDLSQKYPRPSFIARHLESGPNPNFALIGASVSISSKL